MFTLGIILARAGSKGLPDKCVRPLLGRPLIDYTVDHARAARRLDALLLTTDSPAAARRAAARDVEVVDRPPDLASDAATVDAAARHAVETWESRHARRVDAVVLLYANVPVRAPGVIDRCIDHLQRSGASSVRTVAPVGRHHPDWLHRLDHDRMTQFRPNGIYRRQDLEPLYYHDAAVAVVTRAALFDALAAPDDGQAFLGSDRRAIVQAPDDAVDIDDASDLALAEAILRRRAAATPAADPRSVFVIAEAGVNHDGSLDKALRLVDAAVAAGADAVKFQLFRADELAAAAAPAAEYQRRAAAAGQREMLRALELSDAAFARIRAHCRDARIEFLATPFSPADVDRLDALDVRRIKIASTDLDNLPLLRRAAAAARPLLVSCGAATADEIARAVDWLRQLAAAERTTLLHCVSAYPTPLDAANLRAIAALRDAFALPVGFSDHTRGIRTGAWAVAAGACVLEKHLTLDCGDPGPDHAFSLEPDQLRDYVDAVRDAQAALGSGTLGFTPIEADVRRTARKSIVAARDLPAGTILDHSMLAIRRPAGGLPPCDLDALIGRTLAVPVKTDAFITADVLRPTDAPAKTNPPAAPAKTNAPAAPAETNPPAAPTTCAAADPPPTTRAPQPAAPTTTAVPPTPRTTPVASPRRDTPPGANAPIADAIA